jgi:hypothetical protein
MSLAALRRSSRILSLWLLVVSLWGLPHRADGADTCPPAGAEPHDESKHVFSSETRDHGEHCAVCHWLRSVKPGLTERAAAETRVPLASSLAPTNHHCSCDAAARRLPARAPPSFLN